MKEQFTALSIPVEEAFFLQPFRERHISTPAVRKPPHVTVFSPFKAMENVSVQVLQELTDIFSQFQQFSFTLQRTGRFTHIGVLYLLVEPAEPFQELGKKIQEKFPEVEPFISEPILHVTLARVKDLDTVEKDFYLEHGNRLPIQAQAKEICLYEKRDNTWHKRYTFVLAKSVRATLKQE